MTNLKKYGCQAALVSFFLGLLCFVCAFFIFPIPNLAILWVAGEIQPVSLPVDNAIAANWLQAAGIRLFPGDTIVFSGIEIAPSFKMPGTDKQMLIYKPAFPINLTINGSLNQFYSSAPTLGSALWEQGIGIIAGDTISAVLDTPLDQPLSVSMQRGRAIAILSGGGSTSVISSAETVGGVLADAGMMLQNLDYAIPAEDAMVLAGNEIRIVRVVEETILEDIPIPFSKERVSDAELKMGEEKILQSGQDGVKTVSVKVRYEDGKEIDRIVGSEWISMQPISQKTAFGSTAVVQTYGSPDGSVDYWLTKDVHISSYRDTGNPTASGIWPYYGVIAVSPDWYKILKGTSMYVPGYGVGTVLDVCPGCTGKPWIDVFIPTEDYVAWSRNETIYFLPPAPTGFNGDLP